MLAPDILIAARARLVESGRVLPGVLFSIYELLISVAGGFSEEVWTASQALDAATPGGVTFQMWCDGVVVHEDGERIGFVYGYDRKVPEIAAALGKCAMRLSREAA